MQALYENTDGTFSVGTVEGRGVAPKRVGFEQSRMCDTVQVRFTDTDEQSRERVETLFADDRYLTLGVLFGSMVSTLAKHAR
jgi:hypothetical protein